MPSARTVGLGAVLTALVALGPISTDMYLPAMPAMERALGADVALVQLTLSVFVAGFGVAQLVYGPLSDRFGRRPVLIGGLVIFLLASAGCAMALTIDQLIIARFFQSLGACAGPVLGRAVVRDIYGRERAARALAYIGTAMGLVPAAAPIFGGYLTVWFGWRSNFVAVVGFAAAIMIGVLALLHETNRWREPTATDPRRLIGNYGSLVRSPAYLGYALAVALTYAALFSFLSGSSFVLIEYLGVRPDRFGLYFAFIIVGYMTGTVLAARLTMRVGIDRMILASVIASVLATGALLVFALSGTATIAAVVGPVFFFFMTVGITLPNGLAGAIGPFPRMAGAASALLGFAQMTIASIAGLAVGHFHDGTQFSMAATMFAVALGALLCFWLLVWRRRHLPRVDEGAAAQETDAA